MMTLILNIIVVVCIVCWTYFDIRREKRMMEMYSYIKAMNEQNDEKALEYAQYVVEALKNNQTVLRFSAWILQ